MAPSAVDPREEQKRTVTSARVRTNGIAKTTETKPKMNKAAEDLVKPMEGLVLEKTVNSSATIETTNTKAELKDTDMNAVGNDVSSNLRCHFQKADIVKPNVKPNVTTTATENKLAKKIIDQDKEEDAA
ncbi:hypothetical protein BOTCAL_0434g00020 [Botryotinia calthae]|uniref:Uncharacterized protein n=1 Tax=Botryotinia calthae TaxID=38488 RepID=A0A4Y8CPE5_9HELO|nr:hypothetical protein BOTCAL_0434g00020 [Botryotinia calthae]